MSNDLENNNSQGKLENEKNLSKNFVEDKSPWSDDYLEDVHYQLMREKAEPQEQFSPMPLFLMFLFGILLFWGGFYLAHYSGDFRPDVFDPNWTPGAVIAEAKPFDPIDRGKKLFKRTCQQCHQEDGKGLPGVYPPLVNSPWLLNGEERAIKILLKGMSGPVTVLGKNFNGNMPPVGDWKDRDIAAVLTFVRQNWGHTADPISEEKVAEVREAIKDRNKPWTGPEILKLHPL